MVLEERARGYGMTPLQLLILEKLRARDAIALSSREIADLIGVHRVRIVRALLPLIEQGSVIAWRPDPGSPAYLFAA